MIILCDNGLYLAIRLTLDFFCCWFWENHSHKEVNTCKNHISGETDASLAGPPDENTALANALIVADETLSRGSR